MSAAKRPPRLPGESLKAFHRRCAAEATIYLHGALKIVRRKGCRGLGAAYAAKDRAARAVDEDRERSPDSSSSEPDELPGF